jgi:3-hydroxy-9,10-secoandrosta-1,3,5(10)-triene-9,17-dione monooxygenase reductase component
VTRPSDWIVDSWQGDFGFELRPGEDGTVRDPEAALDFRVTLGRFATGVTVVAGMTDGGPVGLTCQSFTSVSLDPPMVLFCVARTSRAWPHLREVGRFAVTILSQDQVAVSDRMATRGIDKFADLTWTAGPVTGAPVIDGGLGHVECEIDAVHEAGDHHVVIGRVVGLGTTSETEPLLYFEGRYGTREAGGTAR